MRIVGCVLTYWQAIHLDHWFSLRKRVRHVQKEKLTLRDDILKLKAEREQVALRMDAIRTKHEVDTKESTVRNLEYPSRSQADPSS